MAVQDGAEPVQAMPELGPSTAGEGRHGAAVEMNPAEMSCGRNKGRPRAVRPIFDFYEDLGAGLYLSLGFHAHLHLTFSLVRQGEVSLQESLSFNFRTETCGVVQCCRKGQG